MHCRSLPLLTLLNKMEVAHPLHTVGHKAGCSATTSAGRRSPCGHCARMCCATGNEWWQQLERRSSRTEPDVSLEEIARRAGVGATTLYRHFADRDDLVEGGPRGPHRCRARQQRSGRGHNPIPWKRSGGCSPAAATSPTVRPKTFLRLASTSQRTQAHAQRLITDLVAPVTARLREAGALHSGRDGR